MFLTLIYHFNAINQSIKGSALRIMEYMIMISGWNNVDNWWLNESFSIVPVVVDTNIWYHKTTVVSDETSITIGSEYDWIMANWKWMKSNGRNL